MTAVREEDLQNDLKAAMKSREAESVSALRGLLSAVRNAKIAKNGEALTPDELFTIVRREVKQRSEAIEFARKAGREDLVRRNEAEQSVLLAYLPKGVSEDELLAAMQRALSEGANAIGPMMSKLRKEFGSRLDGRVASEAVRSFLAETGGS